MRYDTHALRTFVKFVTMSETEWQSEIGPKATEGKSWRDSEGKGRQPHGTKDAIDRIKRMRKAKAETKVR